MAIIKNHPVNLDRADNYMRSFIFMFSPKLNREVCAQSELEFMAYTLLDALPSVRTYTEHPASNGLVFEDGEAISTIFDAYVVYQSGRKELWEVKYTKDLATDERSIKQTELQRKLCEIHGVDYRIVTEYDLMEGKAFYNNRFIVHMMHNTNNAIAHTNSRDIIRVLRMSEEGKMRIDDIIDATGLNNVTVMEAICYMLYCGFIDADLIGSNIDYRMEVRLCIHQ